ncbi:MAG: arsenate reductase family protein [Clostridiales bacterium]
MNYLFICYSNCTTCKKAKNWLGKYNISYDERNIKENNPTEEEIRLWYKNSSLPLKKFFNTSGMLYRSHKLSDKLPSMSEDDQIKLLASDGMLLKRPLLIKDKTVLIGFKEEKWNILK